MIVAILALFSHLPGVQFLRSPVDMLGGGFFWAIAVIVLAIIGIVRNEPHKKLAYIMLCFAVIYAASFLIANNNSQILGPLYLY